DSRVTTFIEQLFLPSLVSLNLMLLPASFNAVTRLPSLPTICPRIKHLCINTYTDFFEQQALTIPDNIFQIVGGYSSLEHLDCNLLSEQSLLHVARMPSLQTLAIQLSGDFRPSSRFLQTMDDGPTFIDLHGLEITSPSYDVVGRFLKSSRLSIRTFKTQISGMDTVHNLFACLASQCLHDKLTKLSIVDFDSHGRDDHTQTIITMTHLRPLCAFKNLKHLSLMTTSLPLLDDADLQELAMAWPDMRYLELRRRETWSKPSRITLSGLVLLLKHCRHLMFVSLVIDATVVPVAISQVLSSEIRNTKITRLNLRNSLVDSPDVVAAILSDILPNLRNIITQFPSYAPGAQLQHERWEKVVALIRAASVTKSDS
ncbi:hypothetical protein BJ138DRAFT_1010332, partial [Hygrophoropsis aurantiaca]